METAGVGRRSDEGFAVDASLIVADANKQRSMLGKDWDRKRDPGSTKHAVKEYLTTLNNAGVLARRAR
jgi:hypothetical protein